MPIQRVVLTYKDYEALPADGRRYEILDGELFVTAAPVPRHQRIIGNLHVLLRLHVDQHALGEVLLSPIAVILADTTVVEPDLVYLDRARASLVSHRGIEGAPALVVEVLSPSTSAIDRGAKLQLYARYGVPHYWIVDPDARAIDVYCLAADGYELVARVTGSAAVSLPPFPDLAFAPEAIFPHREGSA
jgi:Uma2 family endonuclease